ncbi:MAG: aminopeptidase P family protein [Deltaproteobacteria bacterium]|nr:aminopeptidase P family protein [Deltaproteobacteria bacterium]
MRQALVQEGFEGAFLFQNITRFYYSGTMQPGVLYVPAAGDPALLVFRNVERARDESCLSQIIPCGSWRQIPALLTECGNPQPQTLGLEMDILPVQQYVQVQRLYPSSRILDVSAWVRRCRMIKSAWEIENLVAAGEMVARMIEEVPAFLTPGLTELELAALVELSLRRQGHQGLIRTRGFNQEIFYGHILSGPEGVRSSYIDSPSGGLGTGPAFSQGAGPKRIRAGEPISIDYCGCYNGYVADQTRMFSLGPPADEVLKAYDAMRRVQEVVRERAKPGVTGSMVYAWALETAEGLGYRDHFMGVEGSQVGYVGHGVGLELDELPVLGARYDLPLEQNMVVALEPKAFLPKHGMVGIENTFLLTEQGFIPLTRASEDFGVL